MMDVFVLAGQSNMAGRGGIVRDANGIKTFDGATPEQTDPSIMCFDSSGAWTTAQDPMHDEVLDPGYEHRHTHALVHAASSKVCGVGPGMSFATTLRLLNSQRRIGLVPCARGDAAMCEWCGPGTPLFDRMVWLDDLVHSTFTSMRAGCTHAYGARQCPSREPAVCAAVVPGRKRRRSANSSKNVRSTGDGVDRCGADGAVCTSVAGAAGCSDGHTAITAAARGSITAAAGGRGSSN